MIERYEHHGAMVAVESKYKGKHKKFCLCYRCLWFDPEDRESNCPIANELYQFDVEHDTVTPVMECPRFEESNPVFKEV